MSTPMSASQIKAQLKKWGVTYKEYKSWSTHNRDGATGKSFGPVHGFIVHHTGSDGERQEGYLYNGSSALPGPLCHFGLDKDGVVYLIGWGRTNHAGGGDPKTLEHVKNEDYSGNLKPTRGNSNGIDGNDAFYGVEIYHSGSHALNAKQYAALRKLASAICDFHGWSEKSVIAHGEWSSDKWDPGVAPGKIYDMSKVRADVKVTLNGGVSETKPETPKPSAPKPKPPVTKPKMPAYPGASHFKVGRIDAHVTVLDKALVKAGLAKYYSGKAYEPGPYFSEYTKKNIQAFQKSQGWSGSDADGIPGAETWKRIFIKAGYRA
ncbi:N-acetylmuramoyl-L-alanine amidase [Streptomyces sp. B1I3]|uniref:N-acetylmuramoyl-L-alanine amidase n=1 Tax=Streptomyces sp. B1I3 TaxID=3042264 RepID=UPI00277F1616|nr:peptidoglycan-binding protein [Streptomyces sp. B1I3]MDQ0793571.1 hypothetical protein [Streptomyces sp. B1I3]